MFSLDGQVAIITGGAQGIGEGICKVFCKAGATVALWDVRDSGETTAENIKKEGGNIFFQKVDITNRSAVDAAVAEIIEGYGKIDILVNNAGVLRDRSFLKMTQEEWDTVINVNLVLCLQPHRQFFRTCVKQAMVASYRPRRSTVLPGLLVKPITLQRKQESQGLHVLLPEK